MSNQVVPLSPSPNQTFTVQLQVDGQPLTLQIKINWSNMAGYWVMGIFDLNGVPLVDSIPMITGSYPAANVLAQHQYLNIGSVYILNLGNSGADYAGVDNLGTDFIMLWGNTYDIVEIT